MVKLSDFHLHRGVGQQLPNSGDPQLQDALEQLSSFRKAHLRIPLMADSDSIPIADSVPCDGGHVARVS